MNKEHIYHLYPLGFTGANQSRNDGQTIQTLRDITKMIDHLKELNITMLLLGPVFESQSHGYDTIDYKCVDKRLGTNEDLTVLVKACHDQGIKVMIDTVFNHISRLHEVFSDILNLREASIYRDWISNLNFDGDNSYGDGFSYDHWDGHEHLVKLNLSNPDVKNYLIDIATSWLVEYDIDGLRMDAADVMDKEFLKTLGDTLRSKKKGFRLLGEVVHGNYNDWLGEGGLDAITNYEAYKGLYSSLNDKNYYEIAYTLNRQFGAGGLYDPSRMYNFTENHDVNRVASRLTEKRHLYPLYIMLYTMPGFPTLYYGSEYGTEGEKEKGTDRKLRPTWSDIKAHANVDVYNTIQKLSTIRKVNDPLNYGNYRQIHIEHQVIGYERCTYDESSFIFVNAKDEDVTIPVATLHGDFYDVLNDEALQCTGNVHLYKNWGRILIRERR